MNFETKKIVTPTGKIRHQLRVWNYGPQKLDFKRRFESPKALFADLDKLQKDENRATDSKDFQFLYDDWVARQVPSFSPNWQSTVKGFWLSLKTRLAHRPPSAITPSFMKSLEQDLLATGNSQKTVNLKTDFVNAVLNFAVSMETIPFNPARNFKKQKAKPREMSFWEREDAEDFLSFASEKYPKGSVDRWKYVVYLIGINAGPRSGEIWALKPRCLKPERGLMRIDEQFDKKDRSFRTLKGREARNVPLNVSVVNELNALIQNRNRNEVIFQNEVGKPISHKNFYCRVFLKDVEKWGGPKLTFHGLRHTAATLMLSSGVELKTVSEILGHKDLATTSRYLHLLGASIKAASETFSVTPKGLPKLKIVRPSSS
jgi:integrase